MLRDGEPDLSGAWVEYFREVDWHDDPLAASLASFVESGPIKVSKNGRLAVLPVSETRHVLVEFGKSPPPADILHTPRVGPPPFPPHASIVNIADIESYGELINDCVVEAISCHSLVVR